jgi:hypothetical protein
MDAQTFIPVTMCFSKAALAAGTGSTLTTTWGNGETNGYYAIRGKFYSKANLSNTTTPTTDYATGLAFISVPAASATQWNGCAYTIGFDHSGNLKVVQGTIVQMDLAYTTSTVAAFLDAPQFGALPLDFCPIGYLIMWQYNNSTAAFLFGTTSNSLANAAFTFVDVATLPDRPQIGA